MILIDKMKLQHIDGVLSLEEICFSNPWSKKDLLNQLDIETSHFSVALDAEKVVGYMGLQIFANEGYVTNIAVLPEYRGQGIATQLIMRQQENHMDFMSLEVRVGNVAAISLYEKNGFKRIGIRKNFYSNPTEDALIMTKNYLDNISTENKD